LEKIIEMNKDKYGIIMTNIVTKMTNIVNCCVGLYFVGYNLLFISNLKKCEDGTKLAKYKLMSIYHSLSD